MSGVMSEDGVPALGSLLGGRYRLLRAIGSGGMGIVFEAEDEQASVSGGNGGNGSKHLAVKVLRSTLLSSGPFAERLRREAHAITTLRHPNVVEVLDVDVKHDVAFLVMELLVGQSLGRFLKTAPPLHASDVAALGRSILDALAAAHAAGLIHRDVKPDNIFLAQVGQKKNEKEEREEREEIIVKLLDFGLVKLLEDGTDPLTATGTVLGTRQYMAPEQARGQVVDGRADVYSAAACMYYALVRKRPYQAADMEASMFALSEVPAPPILGQRAGLDPKFCAVIERGLEKSKERRPTAKELHDQLAEFLSTTDADEVETQRRDKAKAKAKAKAKTNSVTKVVVASPDQLEQCEPTTERNRLSSLEREKSSEISTELELNIAVFDATVPLPKAPVGPPERKRQPTDPLDTPSLIAGKQREKEKGKDGSRTDVRLAIFMILAVLLFGVGVVIGRAFLFR